MLRVVTLLSGLMAALGLAGCAALGVSTAPQGSPADGLSSASVHPDFTFGCAGGHMFDGGGETMFSAKPVKGSIGYAANSGGACAYVSASTSNIYNAPAPPSGWSAIVYVEVKLADRHDGSWQTSGPQEFIKVRGKHALHASAYYCARWFVADGSKWDEEWSSQTTQAARNGTLKLSGASPNYTQYFNSPFVLHVETVLEVLQPPANDQC